jgi:hypothetical protein
MNHACWNKEMAGAGWSIRGSDRIFRNIAELHHCVLRRGFAMDSTESAELTKNDTLNESILFTANWN